MELYITIRSAYKKTANRGMADELCAWGHLVKSTGFWDMVKKRRYKSTECRIREICDIARQHYEEGNQSKCYRAIWRKYIEPKYGICYRTFLTYINTPIPKESENQLNLFD